MIANTWGTVYRGDDANEYADPIDLEDAAVPGLERIAMAITEKTRTIYDLETGEPRTVRYGIGRARAGSDIRQYDRIFDERTQRWWSVRGIIAGGSTWNGVQSLSLDLRAV